MGQYEPEPKFDKERPLEYIQRELRKIAEVFGGVEEILLREYHFEPVKPRDGMVIFADGTDFNPGSGQGFYGRSNGAWVFLG